MTNFGYSSFLSGSGDGSFRLTNIVRAEPPANLFTPPAEYKLPPLPDKKEE
jgi:hypothetical protein